MLGGRVKTLHPKIHGGILADRSKPEHLADLEAQGVEPIDLVVCNLYPFRSDPSIELIDVGGPTMLRAAAKNFAHVGVIVDPADYRPVLDELRREGQLSAAPAVVGWPEAAFAHTAAYDAAIATWFDELDGTTAEGEEGEEPRDALPGAIHLALEKAQAPALRGEPSPAGSQVPGDRPPQLVGRRRAARRHGAVLPQPVRRRRGLAAGPRAGRPRPGRRRGGQARQPLRGGRRRRRAHRLRPGLRMRPDVGLRRHRRPCPGRSTTSWPASWSPTPRPTC